MGFYRQGFTINPMVYNLTKSAVTVYTNDGNFIRLLPADFDLPKQANNAVNYIVSKNTYESMRESGRSTFDLLCVSEIQVGRHGIEFEYLETYDSLGTDKLQRISPCSLETYQDKDPNGIYHQTIEE